MRVLIDLQHPAHLHFFRNLITRLRKEGHAVCVTGRDKDILVALAKQYKIDMRVFGKARKGIGNLWLEFIWREVNLLRIIRSFKPEVILAVAGSYVSALGKILNIPVYIFYDTEHAHLSNMIAYPFASHIFVPKCYRKPIRWSHTRYNGYHELAYLHPNYFQPNPLVLKDLGIDPDEIFSLVRFVAWAAAHDIGRRGFTEKNRVRAVKELSRFGKVFISYEGEIPEELEPYRLRLEYRQIHHLMAYAALIFGESATMASEGAILGIPGIFVDPVGRGYTDELETEYGLVFNFSPTAQRQSIDKAVSILVGYDRDHWRAKAARLVKEKVDVTEMLCALLADIKLTAISLP